MAIIGGEGVIFMECGELTYFLKNHYFIFVLTNLLLIIFHIMVKIRRQKNNFIIIKIEQGNNMEINPTEFFLKREEYEQQKENLNNLLLYIDNIENYDLVIKNKNKEEQILSRRKEEITTDKIVTTDTTDTIGTTNKDDDIIKILNYKNISPFISQEKLSLKSFFGGSNISGSDIGGSGSNVTFSVNKRFDNPNPSSEILRDLFSGSIPFFDKFLGIADQLLQNNIVASSSSSATSIILDKGLLELERNLSNEKNGGGRKSVIELTEGKKGMNGILEGFFKLGENMTKEYDVNNKKDPTPSTPPFITNNNSENTYDLHEKHTDENSVDETNIEDDDINSEIIDVLAKRD